MRFVVAALFALTIAGCSAPAAVAPTSTPSAASSSAAPTATPTAAATARATSTLPPTPTPITELSQVFRPLANGWRPTGPTLMFSTNEGGPSATLVAVPFGPNGRTGEPTRLVTFTGQGWDLRSDGGALAVAVGTATGLRIAVWDIASAAGRWITPADPSASVSAPVWSIDGRSIFFGSSQGNSLGAVERIGSDGQGRATIATLDRFGQLEGIAPDGRGLIWTRGQAGGSAEILDIATGASRHLDDVARVVSWRLRQPRILLSVGGCCAGRPGGSLVAFDDVAMTSRAVAERSALGTVAFGGGAWDPTGTRIAAARYDETSPYDAMLAIVDPEAGTVRPISDVLGVGVVLWLDEGIVVTRTLTRSATTDIAFVPPQGGPSVTLYGGAGIGRLVVVRP
ncbi:MAG TPA: hypothetical protein VIN70_08750 [Candidatus Limnocylindria bacterium]|jgi:hypothetical protein